MLTDSYQMLGVTAPQPNIYAAKMTFSARFQSPQDSTTGGIDRLFPKFCLIFEIATQHLFSVNINRFQYFWFQESKISIFAHKSQF